MRVFSLHLNRVDAETMLHPDGRFATVSYLGADGVILKGKPESGSDFTVPPQLETDFVCPRKRALLWIFLRP